MSIDIQHADFFKRLIKPRMQCLFIKGGMDDYHTSSLHLASLGRPLDAVVNLGSTSSVTWVLTSVDFAFSRSALELLLHWRAERPYARWFIHVYETRPDKNDLVLEFAKLDYNSVQQTYQEELKHVSRWWKEIGLAEKLPFARDSLVESYTWTAGGLSQPQDGYTRIICTKVIALLTVIDDVYDVYGTLEELELFTDVIQRWDMEKMHELPEYMQTCFLALNKFITKMSDEVLETRGFLIIPYLKKSWADLCTTYLQEARWYFEGYTPRFEE